MSTKANHQLNRSSSQVNNVSNVSETAKGKLSLSSVNASTNPNLMNQGGNNVNGDSSNAVQTATNLSQPTKIVSRIIFVKMGQVDTRNERFDAEAYIECSWEDDQIFKHLSSPNIDPNAKQIPQPSANNKAVSASTSNLINVKNIINNLNFLEYDPNFFWSPQLYIENAIGDLKEDIRYKLEIVEKEGRNLDRDDAGNKLQSLTNNLTVRVTEMRKVRGIFYERLELYDFPMDIQEISITLTSKRSVSEVEIVENEKEPHSINTQDFLDQQEWDLFDFVKPGAKVIMDPWRKYERSAVLAKSYISRKPGYYLYNAYMLIFLITTLGFVPFAFDPNGPQFRCQVTGLLILTSVNFRWLVTQRLPSVPYLTSLDKYAIGNLFHLVIFCVWHSIIGSDAFEQKAFRKRFDCYFLYGASTFFLFYNIWYGFWFLKMSRSIKKFLDDGQAEAKKAAEDRAHRAQNLVIDDEQEDHRLTTNFTTSTTNLNSVNAAMDSNAISRGKGSNNSNTSRTSVSQQSQQPKALMVSTGAQQKVSTNINAPQNRSPNLQQKMGSINEESQRLVRINSIGMNNMIKVNQNLKASV